jgi:hypothetical protein
MTFHDWLLGGLRYRALKKNVELYLQSGNVERLTIAVEGRSSSTFGLFKREYAIALTTEAVVVLKMRPPRTFGANVEKELCRVPRREAKRARTEAGY